MPKNLWEYIKKCKTDCKNKGDAITTEYTDFFNDKDMVEKMLDATCGGIGFTEKQYTEIVPEKKYRGWASAGAYNYIKLPGTLPIEDGATYCINFDGKQWEIAADVNEKYGMANIGLWKENHMAVTCNTNTGTTQFLTIAAGNSHTISISKVTEIVHPIEHKYLNSTHYSEFEEVTLLDETVTTAEFNEYKQAYGYATDAVVGIVPETAYTVVLNGTVYECKCGVLDGESFIGNAFMFLGDGTEDTGEPFCIACGLIVTGTNGYTIKIIAHEEKVTTIPEKYLPNTPTCLNVDIICYDSLTSGSIEFFHEGGNGKTGDWISYEEIKAALDAGKQVKARILRDNHPIICEEDYGGHPESHYLSGVMKYSEIHYAYIPYLNDDPVEFLYCQNPNSTSVMYLYYPNGNAEIYQDG